MYGNQGYLPEDASDPLDDFLAQLMKDIPDVPPMPVIPSAYASTSAPMYAPAADANFHVSVPTSPQHLFPSSPAPASASVPTAIATATTPYYATGPHLTCQWVTPHGLPVVCGAPLSPDPKFACTHFRHAHNVRGNEKVTVQCYWRDCPVAPMQRGSLIRHILTVHLGLLRWRCEACGKMFSRRGTTHACVDGG